jgi:hypothetical protein
VSEPDVGLDIIVSSLGSGGITVQDENVKGTFLHENAAWATVCTCIIKFVRGVRAFARPAEKARGVLLAVAVRHVVSLQ